jgi:hypothetical protein
MPTWPISFIYLMGETGQVEMFFALILVAGRR